MVMPVPGALGGRCRRPPVGQPTAYWNGNCGAAVEWNPLALPLLQYHPLAFVGVSVAVAAGSCAFLLGGPNWLAVVLAFALILGHTLGVCSWLLQLGWPGWLAALAFLTLMERLVEVCWRQAGLRAEPMA